MSKKSTKFPCKIVQVKTMDTAVFFLSHIFFGVSCVVKSINSLYTYFILFYFIRHSSTNHSHCHQKIDWMTETISLPFQFPFVFQSSTHCIIIKKNPRNRKLANNFNEWGTITDQNTWTNKIQTNTLYNNNMLKL